MLLRQELSLIIHSPTVLFTSTLILGTATHTQEALVHLWGTMLPCSCYMWHTRKSDGESWKSISEYTILLHMCPRNKGTCHNMPTHIQGRIIYCTFLMHFWLPSSSHLTAVVQCSRNTFPWSHIRVTVEVVVHTCSCLLLCCQKMTTYHCQHWFWNTQPLPHLHTPISWDKFHHFDEVVNIQIGICGQNTIFIYQYTWQCISKGLSSWREGM